MKTIKTYRCKCGEDFYEDDKSCINCGAVINKRNLKKLEVFEVVREKLIDPAIELKEINYPHLKPWKKPTARRCSCGKPLVYGQIVCPDGKSDCCMVHHGFICENCGKQFTAIIRRVNK